MESKLVKDDIRKRMIKKRLQMSIEEVIQKSQKIQWTIVNSKEYKEADIVLSYMPIKNEVMTNIVNDDAIKYKLLALPRCEGDSIVFYRVVDISFLVEGRYGILEPSSNALPINIADYGNVLCLVPSVAINRMGYRIGFGAGFYDRFLIDKGNILKVGLIYSFQLVDFGAEPHDVRLDMAITEREVLDFRK